MHIVIVEMTETSDPFELLDRDSADLGHIEATLSDIGTGELDENSIRSPIRVRAVQAILREAAAPGPAWPRLP
jgi:hypothetical protein